jgi:quercetin dioxygenase-like cupin family protein
MDAPARVLPFPTHPRPRAQVTLWQGPGRPAEAALRGRLAADGYQVVRWSSEPDTGYPPHLHIYPELIWVVSGSLAVLLPAEDRLLALEPGDRVDLPAGLVHGTLAGPDGAVYLLATR